MTGFFGKKKVRNPVTSRISEDFARRLLSLLKSNDPSVEGSIQVWTDEFVSLGRKQSEQEIERVLSWLEQNAGKRWTPVVRSAKSFRTKFEQLQAAYDRHEDDCPTAEISDQARQICRDLGGLIWPGDEKKDELVLIQRSLDGHREWMNSVRRTKIGKPELAGLADWLLAVHGDSMEFIRQWVEQVHRIAWTHERWAGKLGRHAAGLRHPRFQKAVSAWIDEYKGANGNWWKWFEQNFLKGDGK